MVTHLTLQAYVNELRSWHQVILLYIYIYGLKSLAPINGLTRLLALASCDCLHCKRRFCCELSQRTITNWWRHGRQLMRCLKEVWTNFETTRYSRVKPHSLVVADYWKSVGLVTGSNWTCFTMKIGLIVGRYWENKLTYLSNFSLLLTLWRHLWRHRKSPLLSLLPLRHRGP